MAPTASRTPGKAVTSKTGKTVCCRRAWRSVSKPEIPGMRTSEIIMLISSARSTASACSPEETGLVSKPWLLRNESSRLRWPASSSTIRMQGGFGGFLSESDGIALRSGDGFQVTDAKDRPFGFVRQAFNFPAVGQHDLLHHGQTEAGPLFLGGEIRFEDVGAMFRGNARAVVADFDEGFGGAGFAGEDLDFALRLDHLGGVEQQVEQRLAEQLFVGFDGQSVLGHVEADVLFLDVILQGSHHFAHHRIER